MSLKEMIRRTVRLNTTEFAASEEGAVTVDWVVLTAAIVGISTTAAITVKDSIVVLGGKAQTDIADTKLGPN